MLQRIIIDDAVRALRPDFAVLLMTAEGLVNGPVRRRDGPHRRAGGPPHPTSRHGARRTARFGVNPGAPGRPWTPCSAAPNSPAINRVVDAYNADQRPPRPADRRRGPRRVRRAGPAGARRWATSRSTRVKDGEAVVEHPEPGEVVWRDDAGVTCRRWNWRQCTRTHITERTKNALFILERLEPYPPARLTAAGDDLAGCCAPSPAGVVIETRLVAAVIITFALASAVVFGAGDFCGGARLAARRLHWRCCWSACRPALVLLLISRWRAAASAAGRARAGASPPASRAALACWSSTVRWPRGR